MKAIVLLLTICLSTSLHSTNNEWQSIVESSDYIIRVKIEEIKEPLPYVTNFQYTRSVRVTYLESYYSVKPKEISSKENFWIKYETEVNDDFFYSKNLNIKEGKEYIVFLNGKNTFIGDKNCYDLINNHIGILPYDNLLKAEIQEAVKKYKY